MTRVQSSHVLAHVSLCQAKAGGPEEAPSPGLCARAPATEGAPGPWPPACAQPACCCALQLFPAHGRAALLFLPLSCSRWFSLPPGEVAAVNVLACAA